MARRYTRDNRGRFSSTGATARGGRLRTAAGNKRATVITKTTATHPTGTISKSKKTKTTSASISSTTSKRQIIRGNLRPKNLFTRTSKANDAGYGFDSKSNIAEARKRIGKAGSLSALKSNKRSSSVASVSERTPNTVNINASHTAWANPKRDMIRSRRKNEFSTTSANHYVAHELGHIRNPSGRLANSWEVQFRGSGQIYANSERIISAQRIARRVSRYAMTSPAEFAAEVSAGLASGKKYDSEVMRQYRLISGRRARSIRSQTN